jgi:hypothetical protein
MPELKPTDATDHSQIDYQAWRDRLVRYMCIQRREKNQITFALYELMLQAEIWEPKTTAEVVTEPSPDGSGIYRIIIEAVMKMLTKEQLVKPAQAANMYRMTSKLIEICNRSHKGTYGLPSESQLF